MTAFLFIAASILGDEIFISGGKGEHEVYNMAESYDPETNLWEPISSRMIEPRVGLGK